MAETIQAPSRLLSQALAEALVIIPEGSPRLEAGDWVDVQVLHATSFVAP